MTCSTGATAVKARAPLSAWSLPSMSAFPSFGDGAADGGRCAGHGMKAGHDGVASPMGWCGRARKSWIAGARPGLSGRDGCLPGDPPALVRHTAAAADQVVHRLIRFAEVGRDGPNPGPGPLEVLAEHVEGAFDVLTDLDPGLALGDQGLGRGDRRGPAAVAAVAAVLDGHRPGGGQLVVRVVQVAAGDAERGTHLAGEPGCVTEAFLDVVFDAGDMAEEVPFVGVPTGPSFACGVGLEAGRPQPCGAADQAVQRVRIQASVPRRAEARECAAA